MRKILLLTCLSLVFLILFSLLPVSVNAQVSKQYVKSKAGVPTSCPVGTITVNTTTGDLYSNKTGTGCVKSATVGTIFNVASDFTTAANTSLQAITGLSWTVPASTAMNIPFSCHLAYSQATAAVAVAFGIQDVTVAPTNIFATGNQQTNATVFTAGNLPTLNTTTATAIVSATPSAITTIWNVDLSGFIEQPSNASSSAINIMVSTANSSDLVTVKRGSFCRIN